MRNRPRPSLNHSMTAASPSKVLVLKLPINCILRGNIFIIRGAFLITCGGLFIIRGAFLLCTEVKSLYAVPFSCKAFSRYTRCFFRYVRWLFHYTRCFFHYTHGTSFSLDLKGGQLRMEVKMAATTRILQLILKKTQLRSFDRAVP